MNFPIINLVLLVMLLFAPKTVFSDESIISVAIETEEESQNVDSVDSDSESENEKTENVVVFPNQTFTLLERTWDTQGYFNLPTDYNKDLIPKQTDGKPTTVAVYINIRSINSVNIREEEITLNIDWYTEWADELFHSEEIVEKGNNFSHVQDNVTIEITKLSPEFVEKLWQPDIYIENAVKMSRNDLTGQSIMSHSRFGFVKYQRVEVTLPCAMSFFYYPLDTQKCRINIKSYKYTNESMNLLWAFHGAFLDHPENPNYEIKINTAKKTKRVAKSLYFPSIKQKSDSNYKFTDKHFDILTIVLSFRRNVSFHLAQTYLPSVFFMITIWLFFLLPANMATSKVGLTMTTILTINTMFNSVRQSSPLVSYVKAIDVWMVACVGFAFLALATFTIMSWFDFVKEREEKHFKEKVEQDNKSEDAEKHEHIKRIKLLPPKKYKQLMKIRKLLKNHGLHMLIAAYGAFNVIYWCWLCVGSEYFNWKVNLTFNGIRALK